MDKVLDKLLELAKENHKSKYIGCGDCYSSYDNGIAAELYIDCAGESDRYFSQGLLTWYSGDGEYGLKAHYFDNKLLALSMQCGGKDKTGFNWVSKEAQWKFAKFLATDKSIGKEETARLKRLQGRLQRELSYVTYKIDYGDYECPLIADINIEKLVLGIIKSYGNMRRYGIPVWEEIEQFILLNKPTHTL